ncbi:hypothetical protein [Thiolapillus sp.]|uniref:hypothetical protein n=1 Tax=Thiolapillus sp. TaxID=2017437 RepID=UPI003AF98C9F
MFHTSPIKIETGTVNEFGIAGDCLFFSDDVYVMTAASDHYVYEADFETVRASELYDDVIIAEISEYCGCDAETAEGLLDASKNEWEELTEMDGSDLAELSWWLQGKRGGCAKKMGFDGCEDEDEQGTVYIIPMTGREDELNLVK